MLNKCRSGDTGAMLVALTLGDTEITKGDWIIDSGASCHMTNQIHTGIMVDNNIPDIFVADGKNIAVAGVGDIKVNLQVHKNIVNFTLGRVLYVPDLCSNLLSVSAIIKSGKPVVFENGMCYIKERGVVVAAGSYRDGL